MENSMETSMEANMKMSAIAKSTRRALRDAGRRWAAR